MSCLKLFCSPCLQLIKNTSVANSSVNDTQLKDHTDFYAFNVGDVAKSGHTDILSTALISKLLEIKTQVALYDLLHV